MADTGENLLKDSDPESDPDSSFTINEHEACKKHKPEAKAAVRSKECQNKKEESVEHEQPNLQIKKHQQVEEHSKEHQQGDISFIDTIDANHGSLPGKEYSTEEVSMYYFFGLYYFQNCIY